MPVTNVDEDGTTSECPASRPYWDNESLSCVRCQSSVPFFNSTSKECESCPSGSVYNPSSQSCTKSCPQGTVLNAQTMECQNITSVEGNDVSVCPPQKPIWNDLTKSCSECQADKPYWDGQKCSKCPSGQIENTTNGNCEDVPVEQNNTVVCEEYEMWN